MFYTVNSSQFPVPKRKTSFGGFTLVELLVTVSIFAIITTTILIRNSKFDEETLLGSTAYDVALSIRQAQNFGINVRGQEGNFDNAYGVFFDNDSDTYYLFVDSDGDGAFTDPEILQTYKLGRGFTVNKICDETNDCASQVSEAVVLFRRPSPEAILTGDGGSISGVSIELVTPRGGQRFISVAPTGQISILKADSVTNNDGEVSGGGGGEQGNPQAGQCDASTEAIVWGKSSTPSPLCDYTSSPASATWSNPGKYWYWTCYGDAGADDYCQTAG